MIPRVPVAGGTASTVADLSATQGVPSQLAADATNLYIGFDIPGATPKTVIYHVPKP